MKTKFLISFYTIGLIHHFYVTYYSKYHLDFSKTTKPKVLEVKQFHHRFLTSWNMGLQTLYFMIALSYEVIQLNKNNISKSFLDQFYKFRGYMFTTFVFPCTMVVAVFFWTFYYINKEYVLPNGIEEVVPNWINHSIHTVIMLLPLVELTLQKMFVPSMWKAFIGCTIFGHIYNAMFLLTYFETGKWIYGLYDILTWPQRIALIESMYIASIIFCQIGVLIQKMRPESYDVRRKAHYKNVVKVTKKFL